MAGFDLGNTLAGVLDTVPSRASVRTPEIIGEEIRSLVSMANRTTLWFALEIGRRLTEAKALVGHGGWLGFLKDHTEFSERKAQDLMRVYRAYGGQSSLFGTELANPQAFADLDYTKAVALLALPEDERADFVAEADVESMSTRELKEAIRARDEARKALDAEREAGEGAALRIRDLEAQLQAANEGGVRLSRKAQAAEDALKKAENEMEAAQIAAESAEAEAAALREKVKDLENRPRDVAMMSADKEALDKARTEAVAEMQGKLDKAKAKAAKAEEKRRAAEEALAAANEKLEAARRSEAQAVIANDKELANFELLFQQTQEKVNVMHGVLLKVRGRGDDALTGKLQKALLALSEAIKGAAQ